MLTYEDGMIEEAEFLGAEVKRLKDLLKELLTHDKRDYGSWTYGMRKRVAAAINSED